MALLFSLFFLMSQAAAVTPGEVAAHGRSWAQFLQSTRTQRDLWLKTEAKASVAPELVARVERAGRGLQLIVVAEDWCPDSAYTVPYVARLATLAAVPLRVVDRAAGETLMRAHRTRDGRIATPTIVLVRDGVDVGAWVERPAVLQRCFDRWATARRPPARAVAPSSARTTRHDAQTGAASLSGSRYVGVSKRPLLDG